MLAVITKTAVSMIRGNDKSRLDICSNICTISHTGFGWRQETRYKKYILSHAQSKINVNLAIFSSTPQGPDLLCKSCDHVQNISLLLRELCDYICGQKCDVVISQAPCVGLARHWWLHNIDFENTRYTLRGIFVFVTCYSAVQPEGSAFGVQM